MSLVACPGMPVRTQTGVVQDVVIGKSTLHLDVTVREDDEIRWVNERDGAIQIVFLDVTTLKPQESVSLCFSEPGSFRYTVRLDRALPTGWLNVLGRIVVERNTGAG